MVSEHDPLVIVRVVSHLSLARPTRASAELSIEHPVGQGGLPATRIPYIPGAFVDFIKSFRRHAAISHLTSARSIGVSSRQHDLYSTIDRVPDYKEGVKRKAHLSKRTCRGSTPRQHDRPRAVVRDIGCRNEHVSRLFMYSATSSIERRFHHVRMSSAQQSVTPLPVFLTTNSATSRLTSTARRPPAVH